MKVSTYAFVYLLYLVSGKCGRHSLPLGLSLTNTVVPSPMQSYYLRSTAAGIVALIAFVACDRQEPTEPSAIAGPETRRGVTPQAGAFYYYQGQPIDLEVDPERLVVATSDPSPTTVAQKILGALGVTVSDLGALPQISQHRLLRLNSSSEAMTHRAVALLRADKRFTFASPAFRTTIGRYDVLLLNRVDVRFKDGVSEAQVDSVNRTLGTRVIRPPRPDSGFFAYRLEYPAGANVDALAIAQALDRSPLVQWADPDKLSNILPSYTPTDPYYSLQFHLKNANTLNGIPVDINVESAWDVTRGAPSIKVVIIDDGIGAFMHAGTGGDLVYAFDGSQGYDILYDPSRSSEGAFSPCCNDTHGTAIAGIIASTQDNGQGGSGIAPGVNLNAVRIFRRTYPPESFSGTQVASQAQIGDGINWAWMYANADVISNSWGGGAQSNALTSAIQNALTLGRGGKGAVVVFSAGNTSDRRNSFIGSVQYPATLSSTTAAISVGAINRFGGPANYTPSGRIDVVAPSGNDTNACLGEIVSIDRWGSAGCNDGPGGDVNYTSTFSGTSASAPQVSAVAALILSVDPSLTAAQVKARIRGSADVWGSSATFGAGKLNAYRALTLQSPPPPPPPPCEPIPPELTC